MVNLNETINGMQDSVVLRLENGQTVVVTRDLLHAQPDGTYHLPLSLVSLRASTPNGHNEMVIPVIQEEVEVAKREVERRRIRIAKTVQEREVIVDQPLSQEHVDVNRVVVNRMVEEPPAIRYEGDTIILPVLEEVIVVDIRLMLREEVHVTRRRVETHEPQRVTLRREDVVVETIDADDSPGTATTS